MMAKSLLVLWSKSTLLSDEDRRHTHSAMTAARGPLGKKTCTHTHTQLVSVKEVCLKK